MGKFPQIFDYTSVTTAATEIWHMIIPILFSNKHLAKPSRLQTVCSLHWVSCSVTGLGGSEWKKQHLCGKYNNESTKQPNHVWFMCLVLQWCYQWVISSTSGQMLVSSQAERPVNLNRTAPSVTLLSDMDEICAEFSHTNKIKQIYKIIQNFL